MRNITIQSIANDCYSSTAYKYMHTGAAHTHTQYEYNGANPSKKCDKYKLFTKINIQIDPLMLEMLNHGL